MTAKEYLSQIKTLDSVIGQKKREVADLHEIATSIGSFDYSRDRVQTSPRGEAPYTRVAEKAAELDEDIRRLEDERLEIVGTIHRMTDVRFIEVLYRHYAEHKTLSKIARELHYSYRNILRIHTAALKELERCHPMSH